MWSGDFNGDGKTDILTANVTTPVTLKTHFSKGDGTYESVSTSAPASVFLGCACDDLLIGDFNGDGRADMLGHTDDTFSTLVSFLSVGEGTYWAVQQTGGYHTVHRNWPGDYSGDGRPVIAGRKGALNQIQAIVSTGAYPDLLTGITNPFGGTNEISYKPLTDNTVYAKDNNAVYPNFDVQYPLYVVSDITISADALTSYDHTYGYGGAKAHHLGERRLGLSLARRGGC
jgi:hypothetical protein